MRKAAQRDKNEPEIVDAFRKTGKFVTHLSGKDIPDLLVITPGRDVPLFVVESVDQALDVSMLNEPICLVEVKNPDGGKLTPGQVTWHNTALDDPGA